MWFFFSFVSRQLNFLFCSDKYYRRIIICTLKSYHLVFIMISFILQWESLKWLSKWNLRFHTLAVSLAAPGPEKRIVNGSPAALFSHPHQASIQVQNSGGWHHICGAVLIARNKVRLISRYISTYNILMFEKLKYTFNIFYGFSHFLN